MIHIIYIYKGKAYESYKEWSFEHAEEVMMRLNASYWEIGIYDKIK